LGNIVVNICLQNIPATGRISRKERKVVKTESSERGDKNLRQEKIQIRLMLMRNSLTYTWLINRLEEVGIRVDKTELSSVLAGRRKGPKAEKLITKSLEILRDYEEKMGVVS